MGGCATKPKVVKAETEAPPPEEQPAGPDPKVVEEVVPAVTVGEKSAGGGGGEATAGEEEVQGSSEGKLGREGWHQDETKRRSLGVLFQESDNSDSLVISSDELEKSSVDEKHSSGAVDGTTKVEAVVQSAPVEQLIVNDGIAVGDFKQTVDTCGGSVQGEQSDTINLAGSEIESREVEALLVSIEEHTITEVSVCERSLHAEKPLADVEAIPEVETIPLVFIKEEHPIAANSIPEAGQITTEKTEDEIKRTKVEQKSLMKVETTDVPVEEGSPIVNGSLIENDAVKAVQIESPMTSIQEEQLVKEKHLVEPEIKVVEIETVDKLIQEKQQLSQEHSKTGSVDVVGDEVPGIPTEVVQTSSKPSEEVEMKCVKVEVVENVVDGQQVISEGADTEEMESKTDEILVKATESSMTESSKKENEVNFVDIVENLTSVEQPFKEKEIIVAETIPEAAGSDATKLPSVVPSPVSIDPVTSENLEDKKIDETSKLESSRIASEVEKVALTDKTNDEIVQGSSVKIEELDTEAPVSSYGASA